MLRKKVRMLELALPAIALIAAGGTAAASSDTEDPPPIDSPLALVEDYSYPGAEEIETTRGIALDGGDGNLVLLKDCPADDSDVITVYSRDIDEMFCFSPRGDAGGFLRMHIPDVYGIKGVAGQNTDATIESEGQTRTVEVEPGAWTSVGEGTGEDSSPAVLLELRVTP